MPQPHCRECGVERYWSGRKNVCPRCNYAACSQRINATIDRYRCSLKGRSTWRVRYSLSRVCQLKPLLLDPVSYRCGTEIKIKPIPKAQAWQLWSPEEREERRKANERARNQRKNARRVAAPGRIKQGDIDWLFNAQMGRCFYCTRKLPKKYHIDHFIPLARGGTNYRENLRLACPKCNLAKSAKSPEQFMGVMLA